LIKKNNQINSYRKKDITFGFFVDNTNHGVKAFYKDSKRINYKPC